MPTIRQSSIFLPPKKQKDPCIKQKSSAMIVFPEEPRENLIPISNNSICAANNQAVIKKPVGETPTGSALFNYVSGVTSGVGSATIVNTKVLGIAKKSPPRTLAVTMYLPGAVGISLFA